MKLNIDVPGGTLEIEGNDPKELIEQAAFFQSMPLTCPIDASPTRFLYRQPKGNPYYGLQSSGEGKRYRLNFGVYRDGGRLYIKDEWTWYDGTKDIVVWKNGRPVNSDQ